MLTKKKEFLNKKVVSLFIKKLSTYLPEETIKWRLKKTF